MSMAMTIAMAALTSSSDSNSGRSSLLKQVCAFKNDCMRVFSVGTATDEDEEEEEEDEEDEDEQSESAQDQVFLARESVAEPESGLENAQMII